MAASRKPRCSSSAYATRSIRSATWVTTTARDRHQPSAVAALLTWLLAARRLEMTMARMISAPPKSMRGVGASAKINQARAIP
ncbi:hypothetical protein D3C81_2193520 [compost metagenome]